jgi:hypothetical protein
LKINSNRHDSIGHTTENSLHSKKVVQIFAIKGGHQRLIKIDSRAAREIQSELLSGESIYWAGMPNPHIIFHSEDWQMIPFSLLWAGFAFSWEGDALGLW